LEACVAPPTMPRARRRSAPSPLEAYKLVMSLVLRRAVIELLEAASKPAPTDLLALAAATPVPDTSDDEA